MKGFIWIFALLLTLAAAFYQRQTGPTLPVTTAINTGIQKFPVEFPRSFAGKGDCPIVIRISDISVKGFLSYRKYPTRDSMTKVTLVRQGDQLVAKLPNQPPAGKIEYKVELEKDGTSLVIDPETPIVIRFRGEVPATVLIPHIILMFLAMFFSNVTGIYAIFRIRHYRYLALVTFAILFVGGMVFGPIVQKYAFHEWWAGVPYGWDLTDNKTLIAVLAWLLAVVMIRKRSAAYWIILASLITIAIFTIPHSLYGSQLNQETGKIIQGIIPSYLQLL